MDIARIITFGWVAWSVYDIHAMNNRLMDILGMDIEPKLKKESLQAVMESHGKRFRIVFTAVMTVVVALVALEICTKTYIVMHT
jgi:hypothetical protein